MRHFPLLKRAINNKNKQRINDINTIVKSFVSKLSTAEFRVTDGKYDDENNHIILTVESSSLEAIVNPKSYILAYFTLAKFKKLPNFISSTKRGDKVVATFSLSLEE